MPDLTLEELVTALKLQMEILQGEVKELKKKVSVLEGEALRHRQIGAYKALPRQGKQLLVAVRKLGIGQ